MHEKKEKTSYIGSEEAEEVNEANDKINEAFYDNGDKMQVPLYMNNETAAITIDKGRNGNEFDRED
ncbi:MULTISPECIES: hypothetical protein [Bacillaceae]|uniref:hypothetical protein n=1 Tax=Bacillaceae TaxID=186817 RepID=UPI000C761314|nr:MULTISPECIES: hypothetical protein [Bacillaceae]PLR66847.1 hypothetical protein CYJ36_16420 [Bacillus sp. UMB0893]QNG61528.1 hypothetical protein H4O14_08655 [Bacillus sp. PAMC26568]